MTIQDVKFVNNGYSIAYSINLIARIKSDVQVRKYIFEINKIELEFKYLKSVLLTLILISTLILALTVHLYASIAVIGLIGIYVHVKNYKRERYIFKDSIKKEELLALMTEYIHKTYFSDLELVAAVEKSFSSFLYTFKRIDKKEILSVRLYKSPFTSSNQLDVRLSNNRY